MITKKISKFLSLTIAAVMISSVIGYSAGAMEPKVVPSTSKTAYNVPSSPKTLGGIIPFNPGRTTKNDQPNSVSSGNDDGGTGYSYYRAYSNGVVVSVDGYYSRITIDPTYFDRYGTRVYLSDTAIQLIDNDWGYTLTLSGWVATAMSATKFVKFMSATPVAGVIALSLSAQLYWIKRMNINNGGQGVTLFWGPTAGIMAPKILSGYQPYGY